MVRRGLCHIFFCFLLCYSLGGGAALAASKTDVRASCYVFFVPGAYSGEQGWTARLIRSGEYFAEYVQYFSKLGCRVKMGAFPPDLTIEERALMLKDQVERFRKENDLIKQNHPKNSDVLLIAHSQGGLDARFALRTLKMKGVGCLATIGAPHYGTPVADWAFHTSEKQGLIYWLLKGIGGYDLKALRFVSGLRADFLKRVEEYFEKVEGVQYVSAIGNCRTQCHLSLKFLAWWTDLGPGDGMVSAESQKFGEDLGEYDLDHISEIAIDQEKRAERQRLMNRLGGLLHQ